MSRTVLVTGASGMIGGTLTAALADHGDAVVALVRGEAAIDPRARVARGDLRDEAALAAAFAAAPIDLVVHLAGTTIADVARGAPDDAWDVNVRGTELVLDAARAAGVERAVVASSMRVYGEPAAGTAAPPREDAPLRASDAYGATKAVADRLARSYGAAVVRAGNVYGPGDRNGSRLVPEAIAAALAGRAAVLRSDGSAPVNLLHVDDAVAAYLAIADALDVEDPERTARGEAFNVGGDDPRPVTEVAALVARLAGSAIPPVLGAAPAAPATPDARIDATKLRERTGWTPRVSLEDGLARTIAAERGA